MTDIEQKQSGLPSKESRGLGVRFERIRRITGYLSALNTWNNAKRAELNDRVNHV